jgi:hypothetical protein
VVYFEGLASELRICCTERLQPNLKKEMFRGTGQRRDNAENGEVRICEVAWGGGKKI